MILEWVNHVDLYRIKGVGSEYADLLEEAGVDTVVELATRKPENLHKAMLESNQKKDLVRKLPALSQVTEWVAQAKKLPRVVYILKMMKEINEQGAKAPCSFISGNYSYITIKLYKKDKMDSKNVDHQRIISSGTKHSGTGWLGGEQNTGE